VYPIAGRAIRLERLRRTGVGYPCTIDDSDTFRDRQRLLRIYLNDHLTGATAGVELARRAAGGTSGPISDTLTELADEIAGDREELLSIMAALDVPVQQLKVYAGWVTEKLGRLKPNGQIAGRSPLSTVLELEGLRMAVAGKAAGWAALRSYAGGPLDGARLDALQARAEQQQATLAELHATAVADLFGPAPVS
jgi:hypothetical protein